MAQTLPHTQNGFVQTVAEKHFREQLDDETANDPTTLKVDGKVADNNEDAGSDPYNRTGRFERLVR
jgi:hypothetical protein